MGFVTPFLFWAGLSLTAIPVVLHLIMRQRARPVVFPALLFIKARHEIRKRRLRLQHILLMLFRMLVILLIGMALARPTFEWGGKLLQQEAPVAAVLVFDTSPRMAYVNRNQTRLDAAKDLGKWLITELPRESDLAVLDGKPAVSAFAVDRGAARTQVERLQLSPVAQPLPSVLERALALLATSDKPNKELYIFTDLTVGGWPSALFGNLKQKLDANNHINVYLLDVGIEEPLDTGFQEVALNGDVVIAGSPLAVQTQCRRWGPAENRTVAAYIAGPIGTGTGSDAQALSKRAQETVSIPADGMAGVTLKLAGLTPGVHQGYLQIEGDSPLKANDRWYFTVHVRPAVSVLIVAPAPADSHAVYLSQALAPETLRRTESARFQVKVIPYDRLITADLTPFSAVFLLDPPPLADSVWTRIKDFATAGGGIALFLGRSLGGLEQWNRPPVNELLGGQILVQSRAPGGDVYLRPINYDHFILIPFKPLAESVPWDMFPVYRYWVLDPLAKDAAVVVPYSDGRPCIVERIVGRGRVLTITTPISDLPEASPWNLLPMGQAWPFVILANQIASYLCGVGSERANFLAGETPRLRIDPPKGLTGLLMDIPPDVLNGQTTTTTFPIRINLDPEKKELPVTTSDRIGNYRLRAVEKDMQLALGFSVNCRAKAFDLTRVSPGEFAKLFENVPCQVARDRKDISRHVVAGRGGLDLNPYVLLFLALAMAIEEVLANRFYRAPVKEET